MNLLRNERREALRYGTLFLLASSLAYIGHSTKNKENIDKGAFFSPSLKGKNSQITDEASPDIQYLKSLLKAPINMREKLGKSFDDSLKYLRSIKNADFDWTSALPILSPSYSIRRAGADSFLLDDLHHYSPYNGHAALRKIIQEKLQRDGIHAREENIVVHSSVFDIVEGIYSALNLTAEDSILIATPTFGYYASQASKSQAKLAFIKASEKTAWKISPQELDKLLTQTGAKVFLFANPVNPTGVVYTKQEIEDLAAILKKHRTLVISDEIFKDVVHKNKQIPFSIGAVKGMENLTVTLNGVGKSMGLAGLRISYGYVPTWLLEKLPRPLCGFSLAAEKAAVQALRDTEENRQYLEKAAEIYKKRIRDIKQHVSAIDQDLNEKFKHGNRQPGSFATMYIEPDATNVALLRFAGLKGKSIGTSKIQTSVQLAQYLYEHAGVALVPGEASFIDGEEMVLRIPLAAKDIRGGFKRIREAFLQLH